MVRVYRSDLVGYYNVEDTGMSLDDLRGVGYTTNFESLGKDEEGIGGAVESAGTASTAASARISSG